MTEFTKAEQKVLDKSGPFEAIKIDSAQYYNNYRILMITNDKNHERLETETMSNGK